MNKLINTNLMSHPLNWVTLWTMAFMLFYLGHLLIAFFSGRHPGESPSTTEGLAGPGTDVPA